MTVQQILLAIYSTRLAVRISAHAHTHALASWRTRELVHPHADGDTYGR